MSWTFNSIRIYVQAVDDTSVQEMAKLNPFGGGSIYHRFGYQDPSIKVSGIIVGNDDKNALRLCITSGGTYTMNSPWGAWFTAHLKQMSTKLTDSRCQSMRGDLADDAPVYEAELEFWQEV